MKILVTGGAGYIGSFMTKTLLAEGYEVVVTDSLKRGHKESVDPRADLIVGDLLDKNFLSTLFSLYKIGGVIHFAGVISMEESMKHPGLYFENNFLATLNLLEEMVKNEVKYIVFSSTAGVYGNPIAVPISESHPTNPTNPYGESKLMVEKMLLWYEKIFRIDFVALRYFNAAGAALDGSLGEEHHPETHIIPNAIVAALHNSEFMLFGDHYNTPDGTCIRDYIHVIDLVHAHVLALEKLKRGSGSFIYNVGTGRGFSNQEVIDMVRKITGVNFKVKVAGKRVGDADILVADSTKILHELEFVPKHSNLEMIIKTAWEYYRKHMREKNEQM